VTKYIINEGFFVGRMNFSSFLIDDGLIRAETCREYISYLIKTLSIVAKQKVLLFTVKLHAVISQQTELFITTTARASNISVVI
jgi:hypothetical protein